MESFDQRHTDISGIVGDGATFEIKVGKKNFLNCIIFKYNPNNRLKNNKAIKLFSNGSLHITGAKSGDDAKDIIDKVTRVLTCILAAKTPIIHKEQSFDVQMINTNFSVDRAINLTALQSVLKSKYNTTAFTKDKYPGLKFKSTSSENKKKFTTIVFVTGNIIITGARCADAIYDAYEFITNVVENNLGEVELVGYQNAKKRKAGEPPKKRGRKKKCVTEEFYSNINI